ncbi:FAD-dependent oxidoreductase [Epidermidibacterium keratini]|uniref:FAD-dependent oxidoreductase n=1 Tax=Epidermidibacterium keratini TaxID=1891644 RepID=A0A7L4YQM5_9ACTN|nr:FAD-dependent oxidoreductase [Epidermidibacterium keratini]QHC01332.1 FAD-dependent oxidoreductase [Epidermidibacterium keratini]
MSDRVVIIGNGMVGSRFLEELDASGADLQVTVLGDEPHAAYNRLLLSDVIAGRGDLGRLALPAPPSTAQVHLGTAAVAIDRARRLVTDAHGTNHPYDMVVLATGASARIPDIPGMNRGRDRARGVRTVRTIDDARGIIAAASTTQHAVVLGGGLLGVEVACGLHARGCAVTIVQAAPRLMAAQLDNAGAEALAGSLVGRGIDVRTSAGVASVVTDADHHMSAVVTGDGSTLEADMLILTAGITPNVQIAAEAGLAVDIGVLTDSEQRSVGDERFFAIGDCAQPPEGHRGLIAPGWEHARRAAQAISNGSSPAARSDGPGSVVRLKAAGLDAVMLGAATDLEPAGRRRVLRLHDPDAGRSVAVAIRDSHIEAAVCVGAPEVGAQLTTAFERGLAVPGDPAYLLLDPLHAPTTTDADSPTRIPDTATLCRCNGVTKKQVIAAFRSGARTLPAVSAQTRAGTGCGGCAGTVIGVLEWLVDAEPQATASAISEPASRREKDVARR